MRTLFTISASFVLAVRADSVATPHRKPSDGLVATNYATPLTMGLIDVPLPGEERKAFLKLDPAGFYLRPPPEPHELDSFITSDEQLFQTIHMGAAVVDEDKWVLVVDGLVITF